MWGCVLRAGVFCRARLRVNSWRLSSSDKRLRYEDPSKIGRMQIICRAVYVRWNEIACAATQIADLLCSPRLRHGRERTRDARLTQGLRIRAVLVDKSPILPPTGNISPSTLETILRVVINHISFVRSHQGHIFFLQGSARPTDMTPSTTHLCKLSCFVFRLTSQESRLDVIEKPV
jgi:hypothetical protein